MTEAQALLEANKRIKAPEKDELLNEWVVYYLENGHWIRKSFISDDGAYVFMYTKLREFKQEIMLNQGRNM